MNISEPQSNGSESDRENVIRAFKEWRAKEPLLADGSISRRELHRRSVTERVFRTVGFGVVAVSIMLGVLVWHSGSDEVQKAVTALQASLTRSTAHPASTAAIGSAKAVTENTAASHAPPASTSQPTGQEYSALKQQMEAVASELASVRAVTEQIIASQKQIGDDVAALKASEEAMKQELLSALSHSAKAAGAPKKNPSVSPKMGVTGQSRNEPSSAGAPLPLH